MFCAGKKKCDLFVFIPKVSEMHNNENVNYTIVTIERNDDFLNGLVPKLRWFCMGCILPELADSRVFRGLPIREPKRPFTRTDDNFQKPHRK